MSRRGPAASVTAIVLAAMLAGWVLVGAAHADQRVVATRGLLDGPVLTAGGVAWVQAERVDQPSTLVGGYDVVLAAGGTTRTLVSGRPTGLLPGAVGRLAASPSLIAVGQSTVSAGFKGERAESGPLVTRTFAADGGPLGTLSPCAIEESASVGYALLGDLDVSGDEVASCDDRDPRGSVASSHVWAVDGRTGSVLASFAVVDPPVAVRVAGRFLAWLEASPGGLHLVVADTTAGREVLRASVAGLGIELHDFDLGEDGTVTYVAAARRRGPQRVGWISPASPSAHVTRLPAAYEYRVRVVGGRFAFSRVRDGRREIGVATPAGTRRLLVTGGSNPINNLDFDGDRVAFADTPCRATAIHVIGAGAPTLRLPEHGACPLQLVRRPRLAGRTLTTAVRCRPSPSDCSGRATLRSPGTRLGTGIVDVDGTLTLTLDHAARHTLAVRHRLSARLTVDFYGQASSASRSVTLVRPAATPAIGTVRPLAAGPVFTAGGVAWASYDRDVVALDRPYGFVVRRSGAATEVLGTSRSGSRSPDQRTPSLLSSPGLLVAGATVWTIGSKSFPASVGPASVRSWPGSGAVPPPPFGSCDLTATVGRSAGSVDVDGDQVTACDLDRRHLDVFDGRSDRRVDQVPAVGPSSARIAGPFLGWLEELDPGTYDGRYAFVVFDRRRRSEVLRVPIGSLGAERLDDWDLQADGTIAYAIGAPARLGWTSVADPRPHPIATAALHQPTLMLDGGRITYSTRVRNAYDISAVELDGTAPTMLARGTTQDFDVDATRVTFGVPGCRQDTIRVQRLLAPDVHGAEQDLPARAPTGTHAPAPPRTAAARPRLPRPAPVLRRDGHGDHPRRQRAARPGTITDGHGSILLRAAARRSLARDHRLPARLTAVLQTQLREDVFVTRRADLTLTSDHG